MGLAVRHAAQQLGGGRVVGALQGDGASGRDAAAHAGLVAGLAPCSPVSRLCSLLVV